MPREKRWTRPIIQVGAIVACGVALLFPLLTFFNGYRELAAMTAQEAEDHAGVVSKLAAEDPRYWTYKADRLAIAIGPVPSEGVQHVILDAAGERVAQLGAAPPPPVIAGRAEVAENGLRVGEVVITASLRPVLARTAWALLIGLLAGWVIAFAMWALPLRALEQTYAALAQSEARFRALTALSSDWYWEQDAQFRFVQLSAGIEATIGSPAASRIGKTRWELPGVGVSEAQRDAHRALLERHEPFRDLEYRRLNDRGETVWISASGDPVFDPAGRFAGYRGVGRDITARKLREAQLLKLSSAIEQSPASVVITDARATIEYVNPEFERVTGYRATEALGQNPRILKSGQVAPQTYADMWSSILAGRMWRGELVNRKKNGEIYWEEASVSAIRGPDGATTHYVAVKTDITARKAAELALRESEQRFRSLVELSSDWYWEQDENFRFVDFCASVEAHGGTPAASRIGKTRWEPPSLGVSEAQWAAHRARLERHEPFRDLEYGQLNDSGEAVWISVSGDPVFDPAGRFAGYRGVGRNITARKNADEALRDFNHALERRVAERTREMEAAQAETQKLNLELEARVEARTAELAAAMRELEAFSYSVSHDLRAPVRAMSGFAGILLEDHRAALSDDAQKLVARIAAAGRTMGAMIDGLLELARLSRTELHRRPVDLSALAKEVWLEIEAAEPQRRVELAIEQGCTAHCDGVLLRNVLQNLLGNAFKYTRRNAAARVEFGRFEQDREPGFSVRDNGAGFDMGYAKKLFGTFQRLHGANEFEGTGVGLATVQRIVQRHGGRIWAEGAPGKGATFWFTLGGAPTARPS